MVKTMWQKFCDFGNYPSRWVIISVKVMRLISVLMGIALICLGHFPFAALATVIASSIFLYRVRGVK
jgi:uncharacterized membrane protein